MKKKWIYCILFCFMLCFIWGNSVLNQETSSKVSNFVAEVIGGGGEVTEKEHYLVRKSAHFTEYSIFGVITALFLSSISDDKWRRFSLAAFIGVSVPLVDESIQNFSGRGPALNDVWLDILGYTIFVTATFSAVFVLYKLRMKKEI